MGSRRKIRLTAPFDWHGRKIEEIELREPTGWEAATLGEPRILVQNAALGGYFVEREDVVARYLDKCVEHESGADVVRMLGLTDVLRIKAALFDFFSQAEAKIAEERLASFALAQNGSRSAKSEA
jgi:hypothetical protein